jgi:5-methylthioadenosine/S-adenosylhomocysteine deaminase
MDDLLITGAIVAVPGGWLNPANIHIQDGCIAALLPGKADLSTQAPATRLIPAQGMAAIPALVNGHTHLSQTFMRGLAAGRPLLRWLKELIWPLQDAMSAEVLELAALLGLAENTRSGVGAVIDHQKITHSPACSEIVIRAGRQSGLRLTVARAWADRGSAAEPSQAILDELQESFQAVLPGDRVSFASGPLTPWRCSAGILQAAHHLAREYGAFTHIHVSETREEVEITLKETGYRPVAWLDHLGILDENCQVVHAVWVDQGEIDLLARRRSPVVHCPVSNAVLGSGIAPLKALLEKGISLRLGTDGPASNDTQDCFENMKMALCLARASNQDAALLSPRQALRMATGSDGLLVGQPADLALVRLDSVWSAPVQDFDSALVLCSRACDVQALVVAGECVMLGGKLTKIDEEIVIKEARDALQRLRRKAGLEV